jgi:hypothetical protein
MGEATRQHGAALSPWHWTTLTYARNPSEGCTTDDR